jgi:hypothetical protein
MFGVPKLPGNDCEDKFWGGGVGGATGQSMMPAQVLVASIIANTKAMLSCFNSFMVSLLKGKFAGYQRKLQETVSANVRR